MNKYYVIGQIASLDVGAEVEAENPFMAAVKFKETYEPLLHFGVHSMHVLEVSKKIKLIELLTEYLGTLEGQHGTKKNV